VRERRKGGKGRLKGGSHMQEEEGTQRGDGIRRRYGGKHGKKGEGAEGKRTLHNMRPFYFIKNGGRKTG